MRPSYFSYNSEVKAEKLRWSLGKVNNFQEVFGYNKFLWFFPVHTTVGDGVTFPTQIIISDASSYNSDKEYNNSIFQTNLTVTSTNSSESDNTSVVNMTSETKHNDDNTNLPSSLPD
jgi:hypothetical protein